MNEQTEMKMPEGQELLEMVKTNPVAIFKAKKLTEFLTDYESHVKSIVLDPSTAKGRDAIRSEAFKVTKTRTGLVAAANSLTESMKDQVKKINEERDHAKDELQRIEDDIRRPLTEFEDREKNRVAAHNAAMQELENLSVLPEGYEQQTIIDRITAVEAHEKSREWQEYEIRASAAKDRIIADLKAKLAVKIQADKDAAELAKFRADEEARKQKERDDEIKKAAADKATKEAEYFAAIELQWVQAHKENAEFDSAKAIREKAAADERAEDLKWSAIYADADRENEKFDFKLAEIQRKKDDAEREAFLAMYSEAVADNAAFDAVRAEKKRQEDAAKVKAAADKKRADNIEHARTINNAAADAIVKATSCDRDIAVKIVRAIAEGSIKNISITY